MVRKVGSSFNIYSEKTGKKLGSYKSKLSALKRLRQIEYFKHRNK